MYNLTLLSLELTSKYAQFKVKALLITTPLTESQIIEGFVQKSSMKSQIRTCCVGTSSFDILEIGGFSIITGKQNNCSFFARPP